MISGNANNSYLNTLYIVQRRFSSIELLLNLIQKEYIEQFIFEKGSGGGGAVESKTATVAAIASNDYSNNHYQLNSVLDCYAAKTTFAG